MPDDPHVRGNLGLIIRPRDKLGNCSVYKRSRMSKGNIKETEVARMRATVSSEPGYITLTPVGNFVLPTFRVPINWIETLKRLES